jgi:hypothetical protein
LTLSSHSAGLIGGSISIDEKSTERPSKEASVSSFGRGTQAVHPSFNIHEAQPLPSWFFPMTAISELLVEATIRTGSLFPLESNVSETFTFLRHFNVTSWEYKM